MLGGGRRSGCKKGRMNEPTNPEEEHYFCVLYLLQDILNLINQRAKRKEGRERERNEGEESFAISIIHCVHDKATEISERGRIDSFWSRISEKQDNVLPSYLGEVYAKIMQQ